MTVAAAHGVVVIRDHLPAHKVAGMRRLIEARPMAVSAALLLAGFQSP
jgi:hypothetical protein